MTDVVASWTEHQALALAKAFRLSKEKFAAKLLGCAPRTVAGWGRNPDKELTYKSQILLDGALAKAGEDVRKRFAELLVLPTAGATPAPPGSNEPSSPDSSLIIEGATYQADATRAVSLLDLWAGADLADQETARRTEWNPATGPALIAGYLFGGHSGEHSSGLYISDGSSIVAAERIRTTTRQLSALDFEFGGGHVRRLLLTYLQTDVVPLLRRHHPDRHRREIFSAAAELAQLLGWSAYDAGRHGAAQSYYALGLRIAQEADDRALCGYLLGDLSHQANYLGHFAQAVQLARAAQSAINGAGSATLGTYLLAMEARGLASMGDRQLCLKIFGDAERLYERRDPSKDPAYMDYLTPEELAGEAAHCMRDLGMAAEARRYAELATGPDTPHRTLVFMDMITAQAAFNAGDVDEAVAMARVAVDLAGSVQSRRGWRYVQDFNQLLTDKHSKDPTVVEFSRQVREKNSLALIA